MTPTTDEEFGICLGAFHLFSTAEKERALEIFAGLRFPSVRDRFFEAVYRTISEKDVVRR